MKTNFILIYVILAFATVCFGQFDPTKPVDGRRWDKLDDDIRANFAALQGGGYGMVYNVTDAIYGATGDGVDDYAAILAAEAAADDEGGTLYFPPGTYLVDTDLTFSSNVFCQFASGARLKPGAGDLITFDNPNQVIAQDTQWCLDISVSTSLEKGFQFTHGGRVSIMWFGAIGDGATDCTNPIRFAYMSVGAFGQSGATIIIPEGVFEITKPIRVGMFSTSGGAQGSGATFSWAGETVAYGGGVTYTPIGVTFKGMGDHLTDPDITATTSRIVADMASPYPMFHVVGARGLKFDNVFLDGDDEASEGIFLSAPTQHVEIYRSRIIDCKRGLRVGENTDWTEDPVVLNTYVTGEKQCDFVDVTQSIISGTDQCITLESGQAVHVSSNYNAYTASGIGTEGLSCMYLQSGRMISQNDTFTVAWAAFYLPSDHGAPVLQCIKGHSEGMGDYLYYDDRTGVDAQVFANFDSWSGAGSIYTEMNQILHMVNCSVADIELDQSTDLSTTEAFITLNNCIIQGEIGSPDATAAANCNWNVTNCYFTKDSVADPYLASFLDSKSIFMAGNYFQGDTMAAMPDGELYARGATTTTTVEISSAEILDLADTPITLVAAPGADAVLEFISAVLIHDAGTAYVEPSAPDDLVIQYDTTGTDVSGSIDSTDFLTVTDDEARIVPSTLALTVDVVAEKNEELELFNTGADLTTGTGTMTVKITYIIHTLGL